MSVLLVYEYIIITRLFCTMGRIIFAKQDFVTTLYTFGKPLLYNVGTVKTQNLQSLTMKLSVLQPNTMDY